MSLDLLKKSLRDAVIINKNGYPYIVHPLLDGIPAVDPELLREVVNEMYHRMKKYLPFDKIVTIEAMGLPLASALSLKMNIPYTIIRKRKYGLPGEYAVQQQTGYSKNKLYINGLKYGDNVVIIDDIISTGGTIRSVITALNKMHIWIKAICAVVSKGAIPKNVVHTCNCDISVLVLVDVNIHDGSIIIEEERFS